MVGRVGALHAGEMALRPYTESSTVATLLYNPPFLALSDSTCPHVSMCRSSPVLNTQVPPIRVHEPPPWAAEITT